MARKYSASDLEQFLDIAETDRQREVVSALIAGKSMRSAARDIGVDVRNMHRLLDRLAARASRQGWSPSHDMTHTVPDGYIVKGVSTYYGEDGKPRGQWVKSREDRERQIEIVREIVGALAEDVRGKSRTTPAPKVTRSDLMAVYSMGDPHLGLYAWGDEAGEDFDIEIAERHLCQAMDRLVNSAPACDEAAVINLGDFFHADNLENRTRRSGNVLDVDTRWQRVLRIGVRAMRYCIDAAMDRHKRVRVVNAIGNHDEHSSAMLSVVLAALYEKNRRVEVDLSPAAFRYLRHGNVLIGVTHGDTVKPDTLGEIMATDRAEDWGATRHRYWYTGHVHHRRVFELRGCIVESFRTLAAKDAWHAAQGYRSGRDMQCIVLHSEHGEIERHRVDVAMLT